jgi:agmatinase
MSEFMYASNTFVPFNYPVEEAKIVFLGIPFSSTSISDSSNFGPVMVREALRITEPLEPKTRKNFMKEKICDIGNIDVVPGSYELTAERVKETIDHIKSANPDAFLITIGGDHLITLPVVEALKPKTIIQLDAHRDLRENFLGNEYSHATWANRAKKSLDCDIIQIGTREIGEEEIEIEKELGIKNGISEIKNASEPIYLTIDMDVFDPCYVETGFPVSNGMAPKQVFEIIEMLKGKKILGMDINEISSRELPSKTGFLAAELIRKMISVL